MDQIKIGHYISCKRKALGMTLRQLAEKLNMSDKSVSKWERGVCLPDVSVYEELCSILGISINEFIAGEDIPKDKVVRKSEENIIVVTKDGTVRQRRLKRIIALLIVICIVAACILGRMLYQYYNRPKDYILPIDSESAEVKTAQMVTGEDVMMFRYDTTAGYQHMNIYLTVYQDGKTDGKTLISTLDLDQKHSEGEIAVTPASDNTEIRFVFADNGSNLSFDYPVMESINDRNLYGRTVSQINKMTGIRGGEEQGIVAVEYGDAIVSQTPIGDLEEGNPGSSNRYIYYLSIEFMK